MNRMNGFVADSILWLTCFHDGRLVGLFIAGSASAQAPAGEPKVDQSKNSNRH